MIALIRRLLTFAGPRHAALIWSFGFTVLNASFELAPLLAVFVVLRELLAPAQPNTGLLSTVWLSLGIMIIGIAGQIGCTLLATRQRTLASFAMCSQARLGIGERLKRAYLGYFTEDKLGEITAAATTTLDDIETMAVTVLETMIGGFIQALVITGWLLVFDWRIGLISLGGLLVALALHRLGRRVGDRHSTRRQEAQATLVAAVLEHVQGMAVVKAFGLGAHTARKIDAAIDESAAANIALEQAFTTVSSAYQSVLRCVRAAFLVVAPYLLLGARLNAEDALLLVVASFMVYSTVEVAGSVTSITRVIDASLDRVEKITQMPLLDEAGSELVPSGYEIAAENVTFAYHAGNPVLHQVNLVVPEQTSCAIVGPSGSGKTTLCNLIARFWDVDSGRITIGGVDIRRFTCDSLLANFAIVFQNVYLFNDTIENNIKFGCPQASEEMVRAAARKARCHDFITALPEGYQTIIGEGGSTLSGGEKQRISIARALLKDAPIVILDEATASVDAENEREISAAIAELTRDKTIIMIAHHLATVQAVDQIIVLDAGHIVQRGRHEELLAAGGLYQELVETRRKAAGWTIQTKNEGISYGG